MSESESESKKPEGSPQYPADQFREITPPTPKQVRNRLLLVIITVIALCFAASKDLISLFGY